MVDCLRDRCCVHACTWDDQPACCGERFHTGWVGFAGVGFDEDCAGQVMDEIDDAIEQERNRVLDILIDGLPDGMYSNGWVHSIIQKIEGEE